MVTLAESLVSSSSRPVRLRMRSDLSTRQHRYHGRTYWVVKEPVGLNYFRFHEEEFAILCMLDGQVSLEDIKEQFERQFTPQKITYQDLQQFIGMLHRSGLLISEASGQGRQLRRRGDEKRRREWLGKFANLFALRFRGIDPERILNRLHPIAGWIFSPVTIVLVLMFALSALALVAVQFDVFRARLPSFHEFFGAKNWFWLMLVMGLVKVLHEFGHGLSCKYYGGECHEIGLMLLVFTPCLYCNVSDSWMLPNKWQRAFIGAAGMYVELLLASIATYVWWFSDPASMINQISLSVMFICSVSTILFNGNPLLRYDGYYILMDLAEIPNLRQKATEVLRRFMMGVCLGIEQPENPFLPQRNRLLFGLYTIASVAYRWVVVFSILYFLNKIFEPYGLKIIGQMIAAAGLFGLVVQPIWQLARFFYLPGRMHKVKRHRVIATGVAIASVVLAVAFVPVPHRVRCTVEVSPRDAEPIYAVTSGVLRQISVRPGERVEAGTVLARLENLDLQLTVTNLTGKRDELLTQRDGLRRQMVRHDRPGLEIRQIDEMLSAVEDQLKEKQEELARLELVAPVAGVVLPPPAKPDRADPEGRLPTWSGTPFDPENRGAVLAGGDTICRIGDAQKLEAIVIVDQADIDFIKVGDSVRIKLDAHPFHTFKSKIVEVSSTDLKITPLALSSQTGGELDTKTDASGAQRPLSTSYQARAPLDDPEGLLAIGLRGKGKIQAGWMPLGKRIYRFLARTFHFEL